MTDTHLDDLLRAHFSRLGKLGGIARSRRMNQAQRTASARHAAKARHRKRREMRRKPKRRKG